jgi:hypothetical protein
LIESSIESQKKRNEIPFQTEMSKNEKSARSRKTRKFPIKKCDVIEPFASGEFPFKEKAEPGRISRNRQNKSKERGY